MHVEISEQLPKGEVTADEQVYWQKEPFATSWERSLIAECLPIMSRVLSLKSSHNQGDYNNPILETTVTPGKKLKEQITGQKYKLQQRPHLCQILYKVKLHKTRKSILD